VFWLIAAGRVALSTEGTMVGMVAAAVAAGAIIIALGLRELRASNEGLVRVAIASALVNLVALLVFASLLVVL
jgi:hypothetical protein